MQTQDKTNISELKKSIDDFFQNVKLNSNVDVCSELAYQAILNIKKFQDSKNVSNEELGKLINDFNSNIYKLHTDDNALYINLLSKFFIENNYSLFMRLLDPNAWRSSYTIDHLSKMISYLSSKDQFNNELYDRLFDFMWSNNVKILFFEILVKLYPEDKPLDDATCLKIIYSLNEITNSDERDDIFIKFIDKFKDDEKLVDKSIVFRLLTTSRDKIVNHLINNHIELVKKQIKLSGLFVSGVMDLKSSTILQLMPYLKTEQLNQSIHKYRARSTILMSEIENPYQDDITLIDLLVDRFNNEHLKVQDLDDNTALHYIAKTKRAGDNQLPYELLAKIVNKVDAETILITNKDGDDAIHLAIKNGRFYYAKSLIERLHALSKGQVLLNNKDATGNSYLSLLINTDKVAIDASSDQVNVDSLSFILISKGAIHPQDYSLLQFAIIKKNYNIANTLLKYNKNINDGENIDKPLSLAFEQGDWKFAQGLLEKEADINYLFEHSNEVSIASMIMDAINLKLENASNKSVDIEDLNDPQTGSKVSLIYCKQLLQNIHLIKAIQNSNFDKKQDLIMDILKLGFYKSQEAKELYNFTHQKIVNELNEAGIDDKLFINHNELYVLNDPFKVNAEPANPEVDSNVDEDKSDSTDEEQAIESESEQSVEDNEPGSSIDESLSEKQGVEKPEDNFRQNNMDNAEPTEPEGPSASGQRANQPQRADASLKWLLLTGAAHFALRGLEIIKVTSVVSYAISIDDISNSIHSSYHDAYNNYYTR